MRENFLVNILFNIFLPSILLFKLGDYIDYKIAFLIALAFPLVYGLMVFGKSKKYNFLSIVGFVGILLIGLVGVFELETKYIAYKEAAIPFIIGLFILFTINTKFSVLRNIFEQIIKKDKVLKVIKRKNKNKDYERDIRVYSYFLVVVFIISAVFNFIIAKEIVTSDSGTEEFNKEIGKMALISFIVIAIPAIICLIVIVFCLIYNLTKMTGLKFEEIV